MAEIRLPSINYLILSGRLTHDPDMRYTPNGRPVLNMQIASNRRYLVGDEWKDDTLFIRVTVWGSNAERLGGKLTKGSAVVVEGRLTYRQWESEGQKRSAIEIQAMRVQALDKAAGDATETEAPPRPEVMPDFDEGVPEEELPF